MSARLSRNGNAPMTGPLRLPDGTAGAPAATFASGTNVGFYKTANGIGVSVGGVQVFEFTNAPKGMPIGAIIDWPSLALPSTSWMACQAQSLLRATYPDLFGVIGTTFGAVDGAHFTLPNLQCVVTAGFDSTGRGLLSGSNIQGNLLGSDTVTISQAQLPSYTLPNNLAVSGHHHSNGGAGDKTGTANLFVPNNFGTIWSTAAQNTGDATPTISGSVTSGGSGTALPNVQPTIILNKIIFTGVP